MSSLSRGYFFAGISVVLASLAQLSMKWGMSHLPPFIGNILALQFWYESGPALLFVSSGVIAYILSMLCWLQTLQRLPLNKAYPMLSISYALVYILSVSLPWFHQRFSVAQCLGVALITLGVVLTLSSPLKLMAVDDIKQKK